LPNPQTDQLLQELNSRFRTDEEALAVLEALEHKRREEHFLRYWDAFPAQKAIFPEWTPEVKTFGILGGNRSAKTETGAFITLAWALGKDYFRNEKTWELVKDLPIPEKRNINIWVVGLDFPTLRDVIFREKFMSGRNHPGLLPKDKAIVKINEADLQIFLEFNGRRATITGKSAESGREKFQSASVDLLWFDEECEKEIADEGYQRTVDCGGKILLTLTPLIDIASGVREPWVHDLYTEYKAGKQDVKFVKLSVLDNPHIPEDEKQRLKEKWAGHPEEKARLYGDFVQRSGLVYYMWKPAVHCIARKEFPKSWRGICIIDPAPTGPTAALLGRVSPDNDLYITKEYKQANLIVSEHAKNILMRMAGETIDIWGIDPKGGSQKNAETHKSIAQLYREAGIPVRLLELPEDYGLEAGREYLNATVTPNSRHPKVYFFDDLYATRDELEHYVWATFGRGEMKGLSKEKPLKRNDHLTNCYQYLCAMKPKGQKASSRLAMSSEEKLRYASLNSY
jgi:phage terminase large subunit-like protein